jgi:SET domain-containing protein
MESFEEQLEVKPSTIPGAGNGLFTKVFIPEGTRIVEYKGRITTWEEVKNDSENAYILTVNPDYVIDALPCKEALARYANDAKGLQKVRGITNNSKFYTYGQQVFIEAVKDIPAGNEILVSYGKEYWAVVRANIRQDKKKQG